MEAVATAALDEKERERQEQIKKLQNETCFIGHPFGVGVMNFKFMMGQITGYGMTAIFIYYLYAAAPAGVGLTKVQASQIITLDAALASIFSIVGSFMADRVFGNRRAYRFCTIAGPFFYFSLAIPRRGIVGVVLYCCIGYMNSTGLTNVDGFLSDVYCAPRVTDPFFTEPLLRLPRTHLCYTRPHAFPDIMDKPPCRRSRYATFGCFNNFAKVTERMLALWQKILDRSPTARLLLKHKIFDSAEGREYADARLRQAGIDRGRVEYRGFSSGYLAEYNDVDVALDTAPYTGGLTTCEALYMGVPVVSLTGNRHGARFGYSILHNIGMSDLAAETPEDYVETAVALAASPETLAGLRRFLRPMMARSPLMDGRGYTRAVENMYDKVYADCRKRGEEGNFARP